MTILHAIILGIVEGITEFLPISSTGHLMLASTILGIPQTEFVKSFEIAIQLGAILAVVLLYGKLLSQKAGLVKRVIVAFLPTAVIGLLLYKVVKQFLLGNNAIVLWSLAIGGVLLIIFELFHREKNTALTDLEKIPYKTAFGIGCFQSLAIIPGVSRAAATIVGGLLLGMQRTAITEFSFLLAIPTMAAATGLDLLKNFHSFSLDQIDVLVVGFLCAFGVAWLSVKFLLRFIKTHTFIGFGVYRIIVALLFWHLFLA